MSNIDRLTAALEERYRIEREIGAGGMATVYLAEDLKHGRQVALKVLRSELASTMGPERFHREIAIAAKLQHPHIVPLHDSGEAEGFLFYVMPYIEGESLRQRLDREGELPIGDAIRILRDITDALAYAHKLGVVHRDIKPENVMLSGRHSMVTDFGVAKAVSEATGRHHLTTAGIALGTPSYMAPEQAAADPNVDHRADVYAVGAVGYELLAGRAPFVKNSPQEILAAHVTEVVEPITKFRDSVAPPLEELVMRALAKRPADRWQSADEMAERLELLATPSGGMTPTSTRPITGWTSPVERRSRFALGAAVLAIVALVITVIMIRGRGGDGIVLANLAPDRQVTFTGDVASIDLAPDGRTVAYTTTDRRRVMVTDLDGGGTTEFFNAPTGMMIDRAMWTPDGSRLLFSTFVGRHELYAIPRLGGEPQLLADLNHLVGASGVDFHGAAPDGALVFDLGDRWLYIGTDPQQLRVDARGVTGDDLLELPGVDVVISAVVSPEGRWIAYRGTDSLGQDIVGVVSRDGTSGPGPLSGITGSLGGWSADGSGLYLFRGRGGGNADLYHVPLDPATATMLGEAALVYPGLAHPGATSISKDGRRLVYSSGPVAINVREILFDETAISDDNPTRLLTRGTARWGAEGYLADGRVIITRGTPDGYEILAVDSTGRQESLALRSGTEIGQCAGRIRQSPDGRYLALPEVRRGENAGSVPVILDMTTGQVETLSVPEEICHFAWAPDGSMLAAMTRYSRDKIVVVDRASGQGRLLQLDCGDRCEFSYENIVMSPEWPYAGVTSEIDIWVVNLEDGTLRHLQDRTWLILGWVDDYVWFYRNPNQRSDVPWGGMYRILAAGGTEELMLDLPPDCSAEALAPGALGIACEVMEARQDLHVIDGFDPARETR